MYVDLSASRYHEKNYSNNNRLYNICPNSMFHNICTESVIFEGDKCLDFVFDSHINLQKIAESKIQRHKLRYSIESMNFQELKKVSACQSFQIFSQ
mgnify:CR=1 FL=1